MRKLPMAFQCDLTWADLEGTGLRRHCQVCDRDVVNLSGMREKDARRLLAAPDRPCVRYLADEAGKIVFRPEPTPLRRLAAGLGLTALLAGATPAAADTCPPPAAEQPKNDKRASPPPQRPKHGQPARAEIPGKREKAPRPGKPPKPPVVVTHEFMGDIAE